VAAVSTVFGDRSTDVAAICPYPLTWLHQVHGDEVVVVREPGEHCGEDADAAVTDIPGAALSIHTADCAPVLLWSDAGVIGAAHAGWRGLYAGVLENTVAQMQEMGAGEIVAELGPSISPAAYEFGQADLTRMALRFGPEVVAATSDGAPALDLAAAVAAVMDVLGVTLQGGRPPCTATDSRYYSWRARRDSERQVSVVWMTP
jgi:YfiH family protein